MTGLLRGFYCAMVPGLKEYHITILKNDYHQLNSKVKVKNDLLK
jgi:hypothetical protein